MWIVSISGYFLIAMLLVLAGGHQAKGEVEKIIDKTNWQEAEGLIPAQALEWVKEGNFVMKLGTLNFVVRAHVVRAVRRVRRAVERDRRSEDGQATEVYQGLSFPSDRHEGSKGIC